MIIFRYRAVVKIKWTRDFSIILLKNKISNRVFGCINHIAIVNLIESCFNLSGRTQALAQSSNKRFSRSAFQLPYLWCQIIFQLPYFWFQITYRPLYLWFRTTFQLPYLWCQTTAAGFGTSCLTCPSSPVINTLTPFPN